MDLGGSSPSTRPLFFVSPKGKKDESQVARSVACGDGGPLRFSKGAATERVGCAAAFSRGGALTSGCSAGHTGV